MEAQSCQSLSHLLEINMQMEKMVLTTLSREELQALIIDSLNNCLRHHAAQQPAKREDVTGQAGEAFVSKKQAARLLSCSPSTIDNHARAGHLTRHYVGKSVRFDRQQVLGLAKRNLSHKQQIAHGT